MWRNPSVPGREPTGERRIGLPPFLADVALEIAVDRLRGAFPRLTLRATHRSFLPTVIVAARALVLPEVPTTPAQLGAYEWVLNPDPHPPSPGLEVSMRDKPTIHRQRHPHNQAGPRTA